MKLYILACHNNAIISKTIREVMGSDITHIAIQMSKKFIMESSYCGVKVSRLPLPGTYKKFAFTKEISYEIQEKIWEYILNTLDVGYDYKLFFGLGLNKIMERTGLLKMLSKIGIDAKLHWDDPSKLICIEGIVEACRTVGNFELIPGVDDEDIHPGHILLSPFIEEVI